MKNIRKRKITKGINKMIDFELNPVAIHQYLYPNLVRFNK